jgi:hypothetical protein
MVKVNLFRDGERCGGCANEKETGMGVDLLNIKGLSDLDQAAPRGDAEPDALP